MKKFNLDYLNIEACDSGTFYVFTKSGDNIGTIVKRMGKLPKIWFDEYGGATLEELEELVKFWEGQIQGGMK